MIKIYVEILLSLREQSKVSGFWVFLRSGSTLLDLLNMLEEERGIRIDPQNRNILILVNGRPMEFLEGLNTELKNLDKVVIVPIAAGG